MEVVGLKVAVVKFISSPLDWVLSTIAKDISFVFSTGLGFSPRAVFGPIPRSLNEYFRFTGFVLAFGLGEKDACRDQQVMFDAYYPAGFTITREGLQQAAIRYFDLVWAAERFLPESFWENPKSQGIKRDYDRQVSNSEKKRDQEISNSEHTHELREGRAKVACLKKVARNNNERANYWLEYDRKLIQALFEKNEEIRKSQHKHALTVEIATRIASRALAPLIADFLHLS